MLPMTFPKTNQIPGNRIEDYAAMTREFPIQIALIPPGALVAQYCEGRLAQMALAGILVDRENNLEYSKFYNQSWKQRSVHWLLDNGAWESETLTATELLMVARKYGATEIMAPDVINDSTATWNKTMEFLAVLKDSAHSLEYMPQVAAIAHGDSIDDAMDFIDEIASQSRIKTIAIGRAFSRKVGNPTARLELALRIRQKWPERFQIHLLGFSDEWPTELQHCASYLGLIRSCDTAAPFLYAYQGYPIEAAGRVSAPRPDNYFSRESYQFNHELMQHNIATLDKWARTPIEK